MAFRRNKYLYIAPVHLGNVAANDSNFTGRMDPDDIVTFGECKKESGKDRASVHFALMDSCMYFLLVVPFQADLDLLTQEVLFRINDQRPDALPDIQHRRLLMNSLNILLYHLYAPPRFSRSAIGGRTPTNVRPPIALSFI